jgi:hypothetical protein
MNPGVDLILLRTDGTETILVNCEVCGVTDPFVSFDGKWAFYRLFNDLTKLNTQRGNLPTLGTDIFRINISTDQTQQLTHGEFTQIPAMENGMKVTL